MGKKLRKLKKEVKELKKIVSKSGIIFTDPLDSNSKVFVGIQNNDFIVKGILTVDSEPEMLPITNQKLK